MNVISRRVLKELVEVHGLADVLEALSRIAAERTMPCLSCGEATSVETLLRRKYQTCDNCTRPEHKAPDLTGTHWTERDVTAPPPFTDGLLSAPHTLIPRRELTDEEVAQWQRTRGHYAPLALDVTDPAPFRAADVSATPEPRGDRMRLIADVAIAAHDAIKTGSLRMDAVEYAADQYIKSLEEPKREAFCLECGEGPTNWRHGTGPACHAFKPYTKDEPEGVTWAGTCGFSSGGYTCRLPKGHDGDHAEVGVQKPDLDPCGSFEADATGVCRFCGYPESAHGHPAVQP